MSLCKGTTLFRGNQKKRQESMIIYIKIIILPHKKRINMKKLINFMIAALLLPFAGCKDAPREQPLAEGLVVYKEVNETGDTLTGVRRTADSTVLVTPAAYREVRAEEHFIVCRRGEYSYEVFFRKDGKRLGKFDTFTRMVRDSCDYYFGTSYRTSCFYFPKPHVVFLLPQAGRDGPCARSGGATALHPPESKRRMAGAEFRRNAFT